MQLIQAARRKSQDKNAKRRSHALELKAEGHTGKEIAAITGSRKVFHNSKRVRLMFQDEFQDEAGFGRINEPKYCWCRKGLHPSVPCHHIREYRYVHGAVEPLRRALFSDPAPLQHSMHERLSGASVRVLSGRYDRSCVRRCGMAQIRGAKTFCKY